MEYPKSPRGSTASSKSSYSSGSGSGKLRKKELRGIENANYIADHGIQNLEVNETKRPTKSALEEHASNDPWKLADVSQLHMYNGPPWTEPSWIEKSKEVLKNTAKILFLIGLLYLFICSLDILGSAFRLIAGVAAGKIFRDSELLQNPVAGLMIGVLATVVLQSSSTSTSIIVAMVGSQVLLVESAVFVIMGANIGTSVTSTIVAMTQAGDREIFRRAFAGGSVHDMFNWMTVVILLPLEWMTHYLYKTTEAITACMANTTSANAASELQFLQVITKPLTNLIVQVDDAGIKNAALSNSTDMSLLRRYCGVIDVTNSSEYDVPEKIICNHAFAQTTLTDTEIGILLLFAALVVICGSLILLVKVLSGMLKGSVAHIIKKTINFDFPFPFAWVTGYLALLVGAGMTVIVQSSSVFTSILTPLVGVGVITLERMYPLTLGSNLGTTATSVLAALASPAHTLHLSLQTALVHLFFNLSGVLLYYPVPFLRMLPISAAKVLGDTTAKYRWFAVVYILMVFLLIPGFILLLSLLGWQYLAGIGGPIFLFLLTVIIINIVQSKAPKSLPKVMRDWLFLPEALRSLAPLDRVMRKMLRVIPCCRNLAMDLEPPQEPATILRDPLAGHPIKFSGQSKERKKNGDGNIMLSSVVFVKEE